MLWLFLVAVLLAMLVWAFVQEEVPSTKAAKQPRPVPPPLPDDWPRGGPINR